MLLRWLHQLFQLLDTPTSATLTYSTGSGFLFIHLAMLPRTFTSTNVTPYTVSERPLIPGLYSVTIDNDKIVVIPNDSLNPAHSIVVAQIKPQPRDQI